MSDYEFMPDEMLAEYDHAQEKAFDEALQRFFNIPEEIRKISQWVTWKAEPRENGKVNKIPCNSSGFNSDCLKPESWLSFDEAFRNWFGSTSKISGIGFVFTKEIGFVGVDFDGVIINGVLLPEFETWTKNFSSYTEISQSGKGLHIICRGTLPGKGGKVGNVEMYEEKRFFVFTGNEIGKPGSKINEAQDAINALYTAKLENKTQERESKEASKASSPPVLYPSVSSESNSEDAKIIEGASKARNGQKFSSLMAGDISEYTSQSEADLALCGILAFHTRDDNQIDRIFRMSGLYLRRGSEKNKWERSDYRKSTIEKALKSTYGKKFLGRDNKMNTTAIQDLESLCEQKQDNETSSFKIDKVIRKTEGAILIRFADVDCIRECWLGKKNILGFDKEKMMITIPAWTMRKIKADESNRVIESSSVEIE